jgi:phosphatidylserine/phosphatidylglycerophosphate/cardiolipin synthase-like enzyme
MRHRTRVLVCLLAIALIGWELRDPPGPGQRAELPTVAPRDAGSDRLIVEPDAGLDPIYALLGSPRHWLDLTMYELVDPRAETILADDAERGVRVRVLLDRRLEGQRNRPAYDYLTARGVEVRWASSRYFVTHEKAFVIDRQTAVVMSLNLADQYYATSRDVAVVDHDRRDVAAIEIVFAADLAGDSTSTPAADDLVWSPGQSAADLLVLIAAARRSIALESEELTSRAVIAALVTAARNGVAVSVAMTYDAAAVPGLDAVVAAGGTVRLMHGEKPRYVHAKLFAIDAGTPTARAFVGSENLSDASLLHDRELGVVLLTPDLVDQIARVIDTDLRDGQPWNS